MDNTEKKLDVGTVIMYLIIYSIAGFIIETVFGMCTKGVIESRKSFLYGPFCAIYGIGAIIMIRALRNEKSNIKLFWKGAVLGAIIEYLMSLICEGLFGVKWWDYSNYFCNVDGRTCLFFALSWGFLAIFLMKFVNPYIDKFIEMFKGKRKLFKTCAAILIVFFCADAILTAGALKVFYYRIASEKNLDIENIEEIKNKYAKIEKNQDLLGIINNYYDNEKILVNYPNMMIQDKNDNQIYIGSLLRNIKPYYYRLGDL